jgi:hypothetical protein
MAPLVPPGTLELGKIENPEWTVFLHDMAFEAVFEHMPNNTLDGKRD